MDILHTYCHSGKKFAICYVESKFKSIIMAHKLGSPAPWIMLCSLYQVAFSLPVPHVSPSVECDNTITQYG